VRAVWWYHPKCQVEVVAYESLDHTGSKFFLVRIWQLPRLSKKKNPILPFEKFPFLVLARNTIMLPHLFLLSILRSIVCQQVLREVKNKGKFQTFSYKSGRGRLQEVPNRVISLANFWYFGKLVAEERWSQPEVRLYLIGRRYSVWYQTKNQTQGYTTEENN